MNTVLCTLLIRELRLAERQLANLDGGYLARAAQANVHAALRNIETLQRVEERKCSHGWQAHVDVLLSVEKEAA